MVRLRYSHEHTTVYGIEILSSYMATFAVFIHTLVFKSIVTNKQGAMLYQAGYPFTFYFYWSVSSTLIWNNLDLTLVATMGLLLNFLSMRAFHTCGDICCRCQLPHRTAQMFDAFGLFPRFHADGSHCCSVVADIRPL